MAGSGDASGSGGSSSRSRDSALEPRAESTFARSVCFDRAAGFYDATRGFPPGIEPRVGELIASTAALSSDSRVLEVGIGTGRIARPLARHVAGIVGVDLSRAMLERLRVQREGAGAQGWIEVAMADATRLPFADDSFDAAIGVHVFHLIPAWREAIAEVARVLRPGGVMINAGDKPRMQDVWALWREHTGRENVTADVGISRRQYASFLEESGWRVTGEPVELTFTERVMPREFLAQFEKRIWSSTWRMSDEELRTFSAEMRAAIVERHGSLDREIESEAGFFVRAYTAPGRRPDRLG